MIFFAGKSRCHTHTDLILRAHTHTHLEVSLQRCAPALGDSCSHDSTGVNHGPFLHAWQDRGKKKRSSEIAQKLKAHSPVYKDPTTGCPSRRLAVHLPDGKAADHGADHTANFHHQRLRTTQYKVWRMKEMRLNFNFDFGIHFCVFAPWAAPPWESWLHWGNI